MNKRILMMLTVFVMLLLPVCVSAYDVPQDDFNKTYTYRLAYQQTNGTYTWYECECTGGIPILQSSIVNGKFRITGHYLASDYTISVNGAKGIHNRMHHATTPDSTPPTSWGVWVDSWTVGNSVDSDKIGTIILQDIALYDSGTTISYSNIFQNVAEPFMGSISYWYNGNYYDKIATYTDEIYYPLVNSWNTGYTPEYLNSPNYTVYSLVDFTLGGMSTYPTNDYNIELWGDRNGVRTLLSSVPLTTAQYDNGKYKWLFYIYGRDSRWSMADFQEDFDNYKDIKLLVRLSVNGTSGRTLVSSYSYIDVPIYKLTGHYDDNLWVTDVYYGQIKQATNQSFSTDNTDVAVGDDITFKPNNGINWGNTYDITDFNIQDFTTSASGLKNLVSSISAVLLYVPTPFWTILLMGLAGTITVAIIKGLTG